MNDRYEDSTQRRRLIQAGAERLADALLDLACDSDQAADVVARLAATPEENLERFRQKIDDLKSSERFYDWRESKEFARELRGIIEDLEAADPEPRTGVKLMAEFLEADETAVLSGDDSYGNVAEVFSFDGCRAFGRFAGRVDDLDLLLDLLLQLLADDPYCLRTDLAEQASSHLPTPRLEALRDALIEKAEENTDEGLREPLQMAVEVVARRLGDPALFQLTRLSSHREPTAEDAIEIAEVHVDAGNAKEAIEWLHRFDEQGWGFKDDRRDRLLLTAYTSAGDVDHATEIAWRRFHRFRDGETLGSLLDLIGVDQRDRVVAEEARAILKGAGLRLGDVEFLIGHDHVEQAAELIVSRRDQLDGGSYVTLVPIAEEFEMSEHGVAATVLYRSLLDSVLARGKSPAYHHGARYLRQLDALAAVVADLQDIADHPTYVAEVRASHGRKWRFWQRYEEAMASGETSAARPLAMSRASSSSSG